MCACTIQLFPVCAMAEIFSLHHMVCGGVSVSDQPAHKERGKVLSGLVGIQVGGGGWGGHGIGGETWDSTSTREPVKPTRATFLIMKFLHDKRLVVTVERTSFEELEPVSGTGFTLQEFASVEFEVPVNR